MSGFLGLFVDNLLPVFIIIAAGYLLGKRLDVNPRNLSQVIFYIFGPCLVFTLLTDSKLNTGVIVQMAGFATLMMVSVGMIAWALGIAFKLERHLLIALILTSAFVNAGNIGLSVNLFAFGQETVAIASVYFVVNSVLGYTVGVLIASAGSFGLRLALRNLFRLPMIYALILAIFFISMNMKLPLPLDRSVHLLAGASIPSMLVLLGLQLRLVDWKAYRLAIGLSNVIRLLLAPVVALGVSALLGLQGPARQAGILQSAMPAAVLTTVLATEFDVQPDFVTSVVFTSTLLSPLTLTPLMAYLRG